MGWAFCGTDDLGREIGYGVEATCDFPGCLAEIDRGLGYLCGRMHGDDEGCGRYFCGDHLYAHDCPHVRPDSDDGPCPDGGHKWRTEVITSTPDQPPGERVRFCDLCGMEDMGSGEWPAVVEPTLVEG